MLRFDARALETDLAHHPQMAALAQREEVAAAEVHVAQANRKADWSVQVMYGSRASGFPDMQRAVANDVRLPAAYSISWSGQFEYLERATARLKVVAPATLAIIFVLLYLTFRSFANALLIIATLPFALVGGFWLMYALGYDMSIASAVGFIALGGVAAEFGVVMVLYLEHAWQARLARGERTLSALEAAIFEGAVLRVRPKAMTVAVIIAGLLPIMWGSGTGSEVMRRIAAPMVGGMITAPMLSMFVIPVAFLLMQRRRLHRAEAERAAPASTAHEGVIR